MYEVVGYVGVERTIEMKTKDKKNALTEYMSLNKDLTENIDSDDERYDYVELLHNGEVLDSCFKVEICDRCGCWDLSYCSSNGCPY